jgi:CHAD domain-containing protein
MQGRKEWFGVPSTVREVERKYELPDGVALPDFGDLPGVRTDAAADVFQLEAVYYDTADLRLASHRVTLRRRTGGDDAGWHLKLPADGDARDEIHAPLGRSTRNVPAELAGLVAAYARGEKLAPVARIQTTRTRRRLRDRGGEVLAEVVADEVAGQALGRTATLLSWSEVEVELAGGKIDLLDAVEARLRSAGVRRSPSASKLARVLGDRLTQQKPATRRRTIGDLVVGHLRAQVETLLAYDPRVRRNEPDSVHKMRVATRRLRSALQSFGSIVDRNETRPLTEELKWLAGVLGESRDLEVLRARLEERVSTTPVELVVGPVKARITGHLAHQQAEARDRLNEALDSSRYFALLDALDSLVTDPPLTRDARRPARKSAPATLLRNQRKVSRRLAAADVLPAGEDRDVVLHEARKAAKRARYAGELAEPALGKPAKRFAADMEDVQEELGAHQDSVVTRQALRELGMQAHLAGENGFTFGYLHRDELATAEAVERDLKPIRRKVRQARRRL